EVAQAVQALVFGATVLVDDTGGNLHRTKAAADDADAEIDAALVVREGKIKPAGRGEAMLAQRCDQHRRERNRALACFRLGPSDLAIAIGALPDVKLAALEVNVGPSQAAQLGGAEAGEDCSEQHGPEASGRGVELADDCTHLVRCRYVDADLELAL